MTSDPRTQNEIYTSLRDALKGRITKLTNFTDRSFNYVFTQAYAERLRELEVIAVVSELSGWIDYAGGPVTEAQLEDLGIDDDITADEVNEYMQDSYLDNLVEIVGVERGDAEPATGEVTFTTQAPATTIASGTLVTTQPDENGNTIDFETIEEATTADGVTTVTGVEIQAVEAGIDGNVSANTIVRVAEPPVGVQGVNNPTATTGGQDEEPNDELRARAKNAVQTSSLGGTVDGIIGYIQQEVDGVGEGDVIIEEFTDPCPPFVDVIVDGGTEAEIEDAIEFSRPAGITHNFVRPEVVQIGAEIDILGTDIDTSGLVTTVSDFLLGLGISENVYEDELIRTIMNAQEGIINIGRLDTIIERVDNESFTYETGTTDYRLNYTYEETNGSITVVDASGTTYNEGSDFSVDDQTGDGWSETIVWGGGSTPDDQEEFFVDYDVTVVGTTAETDEHKADLIRDEIIVFEESLTEDFAYETGQDLYEMTDVPFDNSTSIEDNSSDAYVEGTDYDIIDDSGNGFAQTIDWSVGGSNPDNGEGFTITYNKKVYLTSQEIEETPEGIIRDASGDTYDEDTDYNIVDISGDGEKDAIEWITNPGTLDPDEEFYFTYFTEGDVILETRQKADPGTITVEVE